MCTKNKPHIFLLVPIIGLLNLICLDYKRAQHQRLIQSINVTSLITIKNIDHIYNMKKLNLNSEFIYALNTVHAF